VLKFMRLFDSLYSMWHNKCPRCHKGDVFTEKNVYNLSKIFSMHRRCSSCDLTYEKEVSFFYGAMYISYGLIVGWFGFWYILENTFLNWDSMKFVLFVVGTVVLLAPLNFRWSRLLWLNIFYKFEKSLNP